MPSTTAHHKVKPHLCLHGSVVYWAGTGLPIEYATAPHQSRLLQLTPNHLYLRSAHMQEWCHTRFLHGTRRPCSSVSMLHSSVLVRSLVSLHAAAMGQGRSILGGGLHSRACVDWVNKRHSWRIEPEIMLLHAWATTGPQLSAHATPIPAKLCGLCDPDSMQAQGEASWHPHLGLGP